MEFQKFHQNFIFAGSLECQALQPLLFPREFQGFVKGCGWLKTQNIMILIKNDGFSEIPWDFIKSHDFRAFREISAPQLWHAKKTVIPIIFQWLQCSYSSPGTPKSDFLWKYWFQTKIPGIFMKFAGIWVQNQIQGF